jgi:D-glycero-D-manno-heptose 1,7-bisphosphate phosphatase
MADVPEVVLLMGFQGAGKSTLVDNYVQKGFVRLNRDEIGGSIASLAAKMSGFVRSGKSVVLDNTYITAADRKPTIDAAKASGATVTVVLVDTPFEQCMVNVCTRMVRAVGHLPDPEEIKRSKNPALIPPAPMFKAKKALQKPDKSEGMDAIQVVAWTRRQDPSYVNKALFLDFDGCLRDCPSGAKFPCSPQDVRILPNRAAILQKAVKDGWRLLGVSNQSGIAAGKLTDAAAKACFDHTVEQLQVPIEVSYCPHRIPPMSCWCRKPQSGLGVAFIEKYKLDPKLCVMVGDMTSDKTFATRLGMKFVDANDYFK